MEENKQMICDLLCKTLQATNNAYDLISLTYCEEGSHQYVDVEFISGKSRINVTLDSGTAMIRDIMKGLGC